MKPAREVEFEVLGKNEPERKVLTNDDPLVAFVSKLMDTMFVLPGTNIRFGLDPILGLLPGLGDTGSALVSAVLILRSAQRGVPKIVLARMALNVLINNAVGTIPVAGDVFSFWFKSNVKNHELLQKHGGQARASNAGDWLFVIALLAGMLIVVALLVVGAVTVLRQLFAAG